MENNKDSGQYIWRTVKDNEVRGAHAARAGKIFSWDNPPEGGHPGEDYNCRCWAEPVAQTATGLKQEIIDPINDRKKWSNFQFLWHFAFGGGRTVTLKEVGYLAGVIEQARQVMYKNLEDQIADKMREILSGSLSYETNASYSFSEVHPYFGGGTIQTKTQGKVTKQGDVLNMQGTVEYEYKDTFTDPQNIRQKKYGTSSPEGISQWELFTTDRAGSYYKIIGAWKTRLTGNIKINKND